METSLNQNATKMMTTFGATGICVAESSGMLLVNKGNLDPKVASAATLIMQDAKRMGGPVEESPVVVLHAANGSKLTMLNNHGETVVLHNK
ncbi:unnamed protein product [Caenorhabditis bovis]|uniref:Late endosomal/lysosomal adaptor and MAPK and MTOR activator 5 n=1 Tax=Caenorhabditis bovis TaxID=2654633 RepID=A0A8S1ETG2_9PELO|nr:unnamed protein product [Caenorhabditis bovis]